MIVKTAGISSEGEDYQNQNMRFRMGLVRQIDAWAMGQTDEKGKALSRNAAVSVLCERALRGMASGSVSPAPVVVEVPTAKQIADELTPLLSGTVGASVPGGAIDLTALIGKLDDHQAKLKLILREALTHSEMMIDDIAARYITQQHGCKLAVAVDAAEDAYAAAQAKAEKAMGLTR